MNAFKANDTDEILGLLRSRTPILFVRTSEEARFLRWLMASVGEIYPDGSAQSIQTWSKTQGLRTPYGEKVNNDDSVTDPDRAVELFQAYVERAADHKGRSMLLLLDPFGTEARGHQASEALERFTRRLKEASWALRRTHSSILVVSPVIWVPTTLRSEVRVSEFPLPSRLILDKAALTPLLKDVGRVRGTDPNDLISGPVREEILRALSGLTAMESRDLLRFAYAQVGRIDADMVRTIIREKSKRLARTIPGLSLPSVDPRGFDALAGYQSFKAWAERMRHSFDGDAIAYGVKPGKGVILAGPPGTGKSFTAQALAGEWRFPLLRLSLGEVKQAYVGETESNFRRALQVAEALSPCILQVDEADRALSGATGSGRKDDLMMGLVSSLLTWQQEQEGVFMFYTSNTLQLPPALLRRGRLDEAFLAAPPGLDERMAAFKVHVEARPMAPEMDKGQYERLAERSAGLSYAEVEGAVEDAFRNALTERREGGPGIVTFEGLLAATGNVRAVMPAGSEEDARRFMDEAVQLGLRPVGRRSG